MRSTLRLALMTLDEMSVADRDELRAALDRMDRCDAIVSSGPGHQSRTTCEIHGVHEEHYADGMSWTGDHGFSDQGWS